MDNKNNDNKPLLYFIYKFYFFCNYMHTSKYVSDKLLTYLLAYLRLLSIFLNQTTAPPTKTRRWRDE